MGGWLGKMLFFFQIPAGQPLPCLHAFYQRVFLFLVPFLGINAHKSVEQQPGSRHGKTVLPGIDLDGSGLIFCSLHPAGRETLPNKLIQPELIPGKRFL